MKGKNDSTPFLPLKSETGGKVTYIQNKENICLTERQAEHVYKTIEKGSIINTKTMTNEMTQNQDDNPYKFDENSDLSMTYLGQIKMTRNTKIKAEERFPITGQGFASGKLSDGTECQILLDTGATKSYMSKSYYLRCKTLHALPKFSSNTQRIQVGNGQYVSVLFVIPVIIDIHGHRFEIFTLVSEIHDNVDLVMGMKNIFELEGVIDSRESCFSFLSRSIPFFPVTNVEIAPASQKMVMIDAPFIEELSGMAMVKILDSNMQTTNMVKLKFIWNKAVLKIKKQDT